MLYAKIHLGVMILLLLVSVILLAQHAEAKKFVSKQGHNSKHAKNKQPHHHHHQQQQQTRKDQKGKAKKSNKNKSKYRKASNHHAKNKNKNDQNKMHTNHHPQDRKMSHRGHHGHDQDQQTLHSFTDSAASPSCGHFERNKCEKKGHCCSRWGFCGLGSDYCGHGCQPRFGSCDKARPTHHVQPPPIEPLPPSSSFFLPNPPPPLRRLPVDGSLSPNLESGQPLRPTAGTQINVGYYPGWAATRGQDSKHCHQQPYTPAVIPWDSLDYVMFAFVYFDQNFQLYPADSSDLALYTEINQRKQATGTKVMISIGGWSFTHPQRSDGTRSDTSQRFNTMVKTKSNRAKFIKSCIEFCRQYSFDGIDIDWEYPSLKQRGQVTALFQEMRMALDQESQGNGDAAAGTGRLLFSMAGASFQEGIQGFQLDIISDYLDFVMLMAYDLYGESDEVKVVNIHTSLLQGSTENHAGHSVQGGIELYLDQGVPREKLVLGLALYGKTFLLANHSEFLPGRARFLRGGDPTSCIESRGDIAYNEIAEIVAVETSTINPGVATSAGDKKEPPTLPRWDQDAKAFYMVYGKHLNNWVGFDDRPSLDLKLQMVTEQGLAGTMWWSLDQDLDGTSIDQNVPGVDDVDIVPEAVTDWIVSEEQLDELFGQQGQAQEQQQEPQQDHLQAEFYTPEGQSRIVPAQLFAPDTNPLAVNRFALQADGCPVISIPPPVLTGVNYHYLGQPGLVPYVAAKQRSKCLSIHFQDKILPPTPYGNTVYIKCSASKNCIESWQRFLCSNRGWVSENRCYEKERLAPFAYFYGDLQLVRAAGQRDRDRHSLSSISTNPDRDHNKEQGGRGGRASLLDRPIGNLRPPSRSKHLQH